MKIHIRDIKKVEVKLMAHQVISIEKMSRIQLAGAYKHNVRELEVKNADGSLSILNKELVDRHGKSYIELVDEKIKSLEYYENHKVRQNAVYGISIVMAIPEEKKNDIDIEKWQEKSLAWVEKTFNQDIEKNGNNIVSAIVHNDESSPHLHVIVTPIDKNGKLNAYEYIHGPSSLRGIHDSYAEEMKEFGLERGARYSVAPQKSIRKFYDEVNKAAEVKAPKIEKEDTLETYKAKCDKAMQKLSMNCLAKVKEAEKDKIEAINKEHTKTMEMYEKKNKTKAENHTLKKENEALMLANQDLKIEVRKHEELEEELVRGVGEPLNVISEKVKSMNAISEAIDSIEDEGEKQRIKDMMNTLIREGKKKKKEREFLKQ